MNTRIILVMAVLLLAQPLAAAEMLSVVPQRANIRSGAGGDYEVLWEVPRYYPVEVLERDGNWVKISDFENDEGWIYQSLLSDSPAVVVATEKANIREGPGSDYGSLWILEKGCSLKVLETDGDWYKVSDGGEVAGWIHESVIWGFV
jgi:SH3-like domain-containing protein